MYLYLYIYSVKFPSAAVGLVFIEPGRKVSTGLADVHFTTRARNTVNPSLTAGIKLETKLHTHKDRPDPSRGECDKSAIIKHSIPANHDGLAQVWSRRGELWHCPSQIISDLCQVWPHYLRLF